MKKINLQFYPLLLFAVIFLTAFTQLKKREVKAFEVYGLKDTITKPNNPYYLSTSNKKLKLSDVEWKKVLNDNVYAVSRLADTERPFTEKYWDTDQKGTYY